MIVLRALGTAEIDTGVTTLTPSQEIVFAAALYLILERGKRVSRTRLASLLWPRVPEKARGHRLRQTILQLKKLGIMVWADRDNLQLSQHDARSDVDELILADMSNPDIQESLEFLPSYDPRLSEHFSDWLDSRRSEMHARTTAILVRDIEHSRLQADWSRVEKVATHCLVLDGYNETAVLAQAEAAAMRGGKRKAVAILDRYMTEVGRAQPELRLPAALLRRRVVDSIPERPALLNADPPFVGREAEMESLTLSLGRARKGGGSATLVVGDAGIGKTRLGAELARFAELQGAHVERATCRRTDLERPLSLFVDIVPHLRDMPGALGCDPETFIALKRVTDFDVESGRNSRPGDSEMLFHNVQAALFDLLDSVAEERCLVMLIEDVQWLDAVSAKLLARMVEWCATKRIFFLLNGRSTNNSFAEFAEKSQLHTLTIGPLKRSASVELLQATNLRPDDEPEAEFVDWCLRVAEGNPFYLQEFAHHWIETGRRYEAPPSITKVLQERLSRLSDQAIRVLQTCAILSDQATLDRVEKVLEYRPHQLISAVEELGNAAMLASQAETKDGPAGELQPRHDFLSSEATSRLAPISLAFLHRRCADVLQKEIANEPMPTSLLWACANHRHQAGDRASALSLTSACAEHLLEVGLAHDACAAFERSLEYCNTDLHRLKLLPRLAFAFELDGKWQQSMEILRTCIRLSRLRDPLENDHNDFELLLLEARYQSTLDFVSLLDEILDCVRSEEASPAHRVRASVLALKLATDFGTSETLDSIYQCVSPLLFHRDVPESNRLEVQLIYRTMRGDRGVPQEDLWKFAEVVRRTEGEVAYSRALLTAVSACRMAARYSEAMEFVSQAFDHADSHHLQSRLIHAVFAAARLHLAAGHFEKAKEVVRDASTYPVSSDNAWQQTEIHCMRARIALEEGDISKAAEALAAIGEIPPTFSATRAGFCFALAIRVKLGQGAGKSVIEPLVAKLEATYAKMRRSGSQDFEAHALYLGLRAIGDEDGARTMLQDYVQLHRWSKWPLPPEIAEEVGVSVST
jgi:DNA-binding SARP family transcriptional activator